MAKKPAAATVGFGFASAPVVAAAPKPSKSGLASYPMANISDHAVLKTLEAMIKAARLEIAGELTVDATDLFIEQGIRQQKKPENFKGVEGTDEATFIFGKKPLTSPLSDDEATILDTHNVPYSTETTPPIFSFNSDHLADPAIRAIIEKALSVPGLPTDIIVQTPGSTKKFVSEDTGNAVFKCNDKDAVALMLPIVTRFSLKCKADVTADVSALLVKAGKVMGLDKLKDLMTAAAADPDAVLKEAYKPKKKKAA